MPEDDPELREALKRCSPATYYAACKFKAFGRREDLRAVIVGVIERFVDRELRAKLADPNDDLRIREDLALDSLTMMEVIMIAEEVLRITVSNEELTRLHTLGDVQAFLFAKTALGKNNSAGVNGVAAWTLATSPDELPRLDRGASSAGGAAG